MSFYSLLIAAWPLILMLPIAVVLTIIYQLKDNNIMGFLAAIFWIISGAYSYFLRGMVTPPLDTLFQVLGVVGILAGITFGLAAGVSFEIERSKRREDQWEAEREPTMEEELVAARVQRRKTQAQRDAESEKAREEKMQRNAERLDKKYRGNI
jgi:hypothetical protein